MQKAKLLYLVDKYENELISSTRGYQPKEIDRSKIKVPEYLKKNKEPEYEYKKYRIKYIKDNNICVMEVMEESKSMAMYKFYMKFPSCSIEEIEEIA